MPNMKATPDMRDIKTGKCVDMCPHCKEQDDDLFWVGNELDYDDMGLTCCQECMDANPAWQRAWQTISHY